jgi:hypothetical protein
MQAAFVIGDVGRDVVAACLVELGLRGTASDLSVLKDVGETFLRRLEAVWGNPAATPEEAEAAVVTFVSAVLRGRGTALATFCERHLPDVVRIATGQLHEFRLKRAELDTMRATAQYATQQSAAGEKDRQSFLEAVRFCKAEFSDDAARRGACLDTIMPPTVVEAGP